MAIANNFSFVYDERYISLIEKLPYIFRPIYDYRGMCDASGVELEALYKGVSQLLDDQFVQTASPNVIARWEKYCGIIPKATDTLEERRFRVLANLTDSPPYTDRYLNNLLNRLCGEGNWRIIRDYENYSLSVELSAESVANTETIMELVKKIIPANLKLTVQSYRSRHNELSEYTHEQLAAYTHNDIETKNMM